MKITRKQLRRLVREALELPRPDAGLEVGPSYETDTSGRPASIWHLGYLHGYNRLQPSFPFKRAQWGAMTGDDEMDYWQSQPMHDKYMDGFYVGNDDRSREDEW